MTATNNTLRQLAASTAVAMAFSPLANAAGLIDDTRAVNTYRPLFSEALTRAAHDDAAHLRARGFMVELEKALQEPSEKIRIVDYPKPVTASMLRVTAVVPPKGFEALDIPVCAEQSNKVLGTWNITAKGEVQPAPWAGARESESPTSAACKAFILASRDAINQKLAQATPNGAPAQPAPAGTPAQPPPGAKVAIADNPAFPRFGTAAPASN